MRRTAASATTFAVLALLIGIAVNASPGAHGAAESLPGHALVGSWSSARLLFTFAADGTATATDDAGLTYHGAWRPVGDHGATFEFQTLLPNASGRGQGFMGPLVLSETGDGMRMNDTLFVRIEAPDPAEYDFTTPAAP